MRLQGMDYVYTIQGWLKGVNSTNLTGITDPGKDSYQGMNEDIPTDVFGFNLSYFNSDLIPIDASGNPGTYSLMGDITNSDIASNSSELFNGNIRSMQTTLRNITTGSADYLGNAYEYDQLNRLLKSRSFANYNPGNNTWGSSGTYDNKYYNEFSYDANGNILTQKRHNSAGSQLDDLSYNYEYDNNGRLKRNRLNHVDDAISAFTLNELSDQDPDNYVYDQEGRLIKDASEGLSIQWRVDGKIKSIIDSDDPNHYLIEFNYDAMEEQVELVKTSSPPERRCRGRNRIAKRTYNDQFELIKCTYYSLDAQGNTIATYDHKYENQTVGFVLEERYIYGSSRLGAYEEKVDMLNTATQSNPTIVYNANRVFESSNHLGNVLVTFRDILSPIETTQGAQVTGYRVEIASTADYSPFGVQLDGRTESSSEYRYGFNSMEQDPEVKGEGNSYTSEFRQYDPRLGRWLSLDPMMMKYPWQTPYAGFNNCPIYFKDPSGAEGEEGNQEVQKHEVQKGDNLTALAKKYKTSVSNLAKWNNIKDINKIYTGQELIVSDPSRVGARDKFETNMEVGTATGRISRDDNEHTTTANNGVELGIASVMNYSVVYFVGAIQKKIESDPAMKATQGSISSSVKNDPRYGKENFFLTGTQVVEFGGKRWSAKDEAWGGFNSKNPILHKQTWEVAMRELTWALRHATVHYWVEVKADGTFNIEYRLFDTLDLSGSSSRSEAYSKISNALGYVYHDVVGGNKNLQTRATWSVNLK